MMTAILTALLLISTADTPARKGQPGDAVFSPAKVLSFHLTLDAAEFNKTQPKGGGFFGGMRPGGPPPAAPAAGTRRNTFGMELPSAKGDLTFAGKTYKTVDVRYKGNFTVM